MNFARAASIVSSVVSSLSFTGTVFAQEATDSAALTKGGELPEAGTLEITYVLFGIGLLLFVYGMIRLALSYRKS